MTPKCVKTGHSRLSSPLVFIQYTKVCTVLPVCAGMEEEGVCSQWQFVSLKEHVCQ